MKTGLKVGASSSDPSLRMATPLALPFSNSSYLFCSHVRVPWADAKEVRRRREQSSFIGKSLIEFRGTSIAMSPTLPGGRVGHPHS